MINRLISSSFSVMAFSEKTIPVQRSPICLVFSNAVCPLFRAIAVAGPGKKDAEICPSSNIISLKGILFISGLFTSPGCRQARFITSSVAYSTKVLPETEIFFPFKSSGFLTLLFLLAIRLRLPSVSITRRKRLPFACNRVAPG